MAALQDTSYIPVVDFLPFNTKRVETIDPEEEDIKAVSRELCHAFEHVGFAYLKNHGFPKEKLLKLRSVSNTFFELPTTTKKKYKRPGNDNHGYVPLEVESLNPQRPGDLKEAYNITPAYAKLWPDEECPDFKEIASQFYDSCGLLSEQILQAMAIGLGIQDVNYFNKCHTQKDEQIANCSTVRLLQYPPVKGVDLKPGQIRCGEHSDYGSITILFQDHIGGLEVLGVNGEYVQAVPIPDTVIINVGDLMQRWTSDRLKSTKHRVLIPEAETKRKETRTSIAFFVQPDDECLIECLDGSNKYTPITSRDYMLSRFSKTYI